MTIKNISEPITSHAINRTEHPAIIDANTDCTFSYGQLERQIIATVCRLSQLKVRTGNLIGVALSDTIEHVILQLALARIGAIHLPLDWRWAQSEIETVINEFRPSIIILEPAVLNNFKGKRFSVREIFKSNSSDVLEKFQAVFKPSYNPDAPLLVSLSSGTTGTPTGPTLNHSHMINRFIAQSISLKFSWHDRFLATTPLYFGGGRTFVLSCLFMGGTVVLDCPPWKPKNFISTLKKYSPNLTFLVPTQIRDLLSLEKELLKNCSVLSTLISSGSPLHKHERKRVIKYICPGLVEYYASTEGGGISALFANEMENVPESVGKPIFRVEVSITDQNNNKLPNGQIGLIKYRGPAVANSTQINKKKSNVSNEEEWFYPGDLGELDTNGYLYLRGRAKDIIIRGGINIYPQEIENVIIQISDIQEVSVFSLPDDHYGEIVAAAIVVKHKNITKNIMRKCTQLLAPYKIPSIIIELKELPKNSGGKIIKDKLQKIALENRKHEIEQ